MRCAGLLILLTTLVLFLVRVARFGADPASDPEIQHILDSIRELPEEQ